jgi:hypothetical protein
MAKSGYGSAAIIVVVFLDAIVAIRCGMVLPLYGCTQRMERELEGEVKLDHYALLVKRIRSILTAMIYLSARFN